MRRLAYLFIAILFLTANVFAYESIDLLNKFNLASYFDDYLGFVYESHGCLHFTPSDIYLLAKTIPPGTELNILKYNYPFISDKSVPFFADIATNDLKYFDRTKTVINVYPSQGILEIKVDNKPYAYVKTLAGPEYDFLMPYEIKKGQPIKWDFMLSGPTDPGKYYVLRSTNHYISNAYYQNTVVPFGAWIVKKNGKWLFEKNGKWYQLPQNILMILTGLMKNKFIIIMILAPTPGATLAMILANMFCFGQKMARIIIRKWVMLPENYIMSKLF